MGIDRNNGVVELVVLMIGYGYSDWRIRRLVRIKLSPYRMQHDTQSGNQRSHPDTGVVTDF